MDPTKLKQNNMQPFSPAGITMVVTPWWFDEHGNKCREIYQDETATKEKNPDAVQTAEAK